MATDWSKFTPINDGPKDSVDWSKFTPIDTAEAAYPESAAIRNTRSPTAQSTVAGGDDDWAAINSAASAEANPTGPAPDAATAAFRKDINSRMPTGMELSGSMASGIGSLGGMMEGAKAHFRAMNYKAVGDTLATLDRIDKGDTANLGDDMVTNSYANADATSRAAVRGRLTSQLLKDQGFIADAAKAKKEYDEFSKDIGGRVPSMSDINSPYGFAQWALKGGIASSPTMAVAMAGTALGGLPGALLAGGALAVGDISGGHLDYSNEATDPKRFNSADRAAEAAQAQPGLIAGHMADVSRDTNLLAVPYAALDLAGPVGTMAIGGAKKLAAKSVASALSSGAKHLPKEMLGEGGGEGGQEIVNIVSEMLGGERSTTVTAADAQRVLESAAMGMVIAPGGHAANVATDVYHAATREKNFEEALLEADSKRLYAGKTSFANPNGPASQAGITPVMVSIPKNTGAPIVSTESEPATVATGSGVGAGDTAVASMGNTGPIPVMSTGPGVGDTAQAPAPSISTVEPAPNAGAQPASPVTHASISDGSIKRTTDDDLLSKVPVEQEPKTILSGNEGTGYTIGDAKVQQEAHQKRHGGLDWKVEPLDNGKFRVAAYEAQGVSNEAALSDTQVPGDGAPHRGRATEANGTQGLPKVSGADSEKAFRENAQRDIDLERENYLSRVAPENRTAAEANMPVIRLGEVDPKLKPETDRIKTAVAGFYSVDSSRVQFFSDPSDDAPNGFTRGGVAWINSRNVTVDATHTAGHEGHHILEQIAKLDDAEQAKRGNGWVQTPAQKYRDKTHAIFGSMSLKGQKQYANQFLYKAELDAQDAKLRKQGRSEPEILMSRQRRVIEKLSNPETKSEMVADFAGNRFTDPKFLKSLRDADETGFAKLASDWSKILRDLVNALRGQKGKNRESEAVDGYINKLEDQIVAFRDALIELKNSGANGLEPAIIGLEPVVKMAYKRKGVYAEVAPDPRNTEVKTQWDGLSGIDKAKSTKEVMDALLANVQRMMGLQGWGVEYTTGMFEGGVNPSAFLTAPEGASEQDLAEVAKVMGYLLDQKGMVSFDENNTTSESQAGFVKVVLPEGMEQGRIDEIRLAIAKAVPQAEGDSLRDGALVFGNFSAFNDKIETLTDIKFHDAIRAYVETIPESLEVVKPRKFHSEYMQGSWSDEYTPTNRDGYLEGTRYGSDSSRVETGRDNLRGRSGRSDVEQLRRLAQATDAKLRKYIGHYRASPTTRRGAGVNEAVAGAEREYGSPREGAVSRVGVHYSQQRRPTLSSQYHGAGLKGAERERMGMRGAIGERLYFYVDKGNGVIPEAGVGGVKHTIKLNNLYDMNADKYGYMKAASNPDPLQRITNWERMVKDAGFDGWTADNGGNQAFAVLLGKHAIEIPSYKRKSEGNDIDNIDDLGAFNLDRDYAESTNDDFSFPDLSEASAKLDNAAPTELEMAQRLRDEIDDAEKFRELLERELNDAGFSVVGTPKMASAKEKNFAEVKPAEIKAKGMMAEEAYPDLEYHKDPSDSTAERAFFVVDGRRYKATISSGSPKVQDGAVEAHAKGKAKGFMLGYELGGLSLQAKKNWNKRFAASADLMRRGFDLYTSIPAKARENVLSTWKAIAANPAAFEFSKAENVKGANVKEVAQDIADKMMVVGRYKVKIELPNYSRGTNDFGITITDTKTGATGNADVEFWQREKEVTMHTHELDKGSGMGKPVYQIGQAFADKFGARIHADGILLGVNNYRRTEQMFSGMLRSGNYDTMQPGVGQRIYGWNERLKNQDQQDRNMIRVALAATRNVLEFAPEMKNIGFDLATNKFYFKNKPDSIENRLMAGAKVKSILSSSDVRVASISRSTLARAAITLGAMDGEAVNAQNIAEPVLYKRKEAVSDPKLERWAEGVFSRGAKPGDGVVISNTLPHDAMTMSPGTEAFGRNQPVVIEGHALGHAAKHLKDGITAKMIGMLPDALKSPRMISFQAPGQMMVMLPIRTADGSPVVVILKKETMGQGRMQVKVARFSTTYPLTNSASYLVAEIKKGNRVWLPLEEVSRLQELLSGANFPSGSESPRHTSGPSISGGSTPSREAFNVLSDDALVKKQSGNKDWAKATEQIIIKDDAEKQLRGIAFKRKQIQRAKGLKDESWFATQRRRFQDQYIQIRNLQDMLTERGGKVGEEQDVYRAEERMHGRTQELLTDFANNQLKPFIESAAKAKIDLDEIALYAYAKHAQERNEHISTINKKIGDAGSGMSTAEADNIIQMVKLAGDEQKFDGLHQQLMGITSTTRRVLLDEGLITQDEHDGWDGLYDNYVPLRGFEDVNDEGEKSSGLRVNRGFSTTGKESIKALGRNSKAGDILENIIRDYERAVIRGEKNAVSKTFLDLALSNPDPDLWEVQPMTRKRSFNKASGLVLMNSARDTGEDTINIKVGGQDVRVKIKDPLILRAMKNASKDETSQLERILSQTLGLYTTLMRNTLTRFNPIFGALNAVRDAQMGLVSSYDELGLKGAALYSKYLASSLAASFRKERGKSDPANKVMDRWIMEMRFAGGTTGGYHLRDTSEITDTMRDMMLAAGAQPNGTWESVRASKPYQAASIALDWLEIIGATSEDAARAASYRAAREIGKTPAQAASISKNLTTNFNRKGEWGGTLNQLFLFFNAGVQGSTRVLQSLANPRVQKLMAGATAAAMTLAMMNAGMGDDDDGQNYWDKIPDFEKERNLIFMLPPGVEMEGANQIGTRGRYVKIPMAYGLNVFAVLGNQLADSVRWAKDRNHGVSPLKSGVRIASAVFGSINPFGGSFNPTNAIELAAAVSPTAVDLAIQLGTGTNSFGRPIGPTKSPLDNKPDSENFSARQAGTASQFAARWMNSVTGGNEARSGAIDIMPGTIDNVVRNATGGLGVFIADTLVNLPTKAFSPVEVTNRDIPLYRNFFGQIDEVTDMGLFYDRRAEVQKEAAAAHAEMKAGIEVDYTEEQLSKLGLAKVAETYTKVLSGLRKQEIRVAGDDDLTWKEKRLARSDIEKQRASLAQSFNQIYNDSAKAANAK